MTREEFIDRIDDIMCGTSNAERAYLEDLYYEVTKPQWISVEEELPEDNVEVLTVNKFNFPVVCYRFRGYWFSRHGNEYVGITHWMPLPQAPKEGGKE